MAAVPGLPQLRQGERHVSRSTRLHPQRPRSRQLPLFSRNRLGRPPHRHPRALQVHQQPTGQLPRLRLPQRGVRHLVQDHTGRRGHQPGLHPQRVREVLRVHRSHQPRQHAGGQQLHRRPAHRVPHPAQRYAGGSALVPVPRAHQTRQVRRRYVGHLFHPLHACLHDRIRGAYRTTFRQPRPRTRRLAHLRPEHLRCIGQPDSHVHGIVHLHRGEQRQEAGELHSAAGHLARHRPNAATAYREQRGGYAHRREQHGSKRCRCRVQEHKLRHAPLQPAADVRSRQHNPNQHHTAGQQRAGTLHKTRLGLQHQLLRVPDTAQAHPRGAVRYELQHGQTHRLARGKHAQPHPLKAHRSEEAAQQDESTGTGIVLHRIYHQRLGHAKEPD